MKRVTQFFRLLQINIVLMRYTFTPEVVGTRYPIIRFLAYVNPWRMLAKPSRSRGESIRFALSSLGPIFRQIWTIAINQTRFTTQRHCR